MIRSVLRNMLLVSCLVSFLSGPSYGRIQPHADVGTQTQMSEAFGVGTQTQSGQSRRLVLTTAAVVLAGFAVAVQYAKNYFTQVEPIDSEISFEVNNSSEDANINRTIVEVSEKPFQQSLPPEGPFKKVCTTCTFIKNVLTCRCPSQAAAAEEEEGEEKVWAPASLTLPCRDGSVIVESLNGTLKCYYDRIEDQLKDKPCQRNLNQILSIFDGMMGCHYPIPEGAYKKSCETCKYEQDDVLSCSCRSNGYNWNRAKIQMPCADNSLCLENVDGQLACVYRSTVVNTSGLIVR